MLKINFLNSKIIDSLKEKGCPLCYLEIEFLQKYITEIIDEYNSDNNVINKFKRSYGFCVEHNNELLKLLKKNYHLSKSSIAKLYEKTIPLFINSLSSMDDKKDSIIDNFLLRLNKSSSNKNEISTECMCCTAIKEESENNILTLLELLKEKEFQSEYYISDGICIPHFRKCLSFIDKSGIISSARNYLIEDQKERLELLIFRLESLNEKKNYRNKEIISEEEARSWYEAIWRFSGYKFNTQPDPTRMN